MVKVSINGVQYQICSEWADVDCNRLKDCKTFKDELKILTDVPGEIIDKADGTSLFPLYTIFSFIDDMDAMPFVEALQIATVPYDDFETAKAFLKTDSKPYVKYINVSRVFYPEETNSYRIIGLGVSIVNQISTFLSSYQDMITDKPDEESVQAGIEELSVFGIFGVAYTLAGEDILKIEQVMKLPTIRVYTSLYYNWRKARYMKRLFDIKNPKKPK